MRILHVGWGFSPWRPGGLITYAEDLMAAQLARGHEVSYFLSGRRYPYVSGPRIKRWRRRGVTMHEIVNGPIIAGLEHGTRDPDRDLSEPWTEAAFGRVLDEVRPDVVHLQELHGLPSSLIEVAHAAGRPTLMTLQDYGPLCATLRLFDADGKICLRRDVGADCVARNADAPDAGPLIERTIEFEIARARQILRVPESTDFARVASVVGWLRTHAVRRGREDAPAAERPPAEADPGGRLAPAFQRRRDVNVDRLGGVGRLIAQSPRVAEIYRTLGVRAEHVTTLPFTLGHIERLQPRTFTSPPSPVTFATLNGCASASKGSHTILVALRALRAAGLEGEFRLRVLGYVDPLVGDELGTFRGVELGGLYGRDELDGLLETVDVGLIPSMWEEALGYTGPELIAKGVPLIANPLGGIVEYAREGQTAWLNQSCSGEGLAEIMGTLIGAPELICEMHSRLMEVRDEIVVPMDRHVDAMERIYGELSSHASRNEGASSRVK